MSLSQRSFAGGELAPALHARVDTAKYLVGLKTMRNFTTMRHGGAASRAGTTLVAEVKYSTKRVRLIEFIFNADQTYVLEFGNLYMRVHRQGVQLQAAGIPYEIVTPYLEADLQDLTYVQSADVITIAHKNYPVQEVKRTGHTAWTIAPMNFANSMDVPTASSVTYAAGGGISARYLITAVDADTGEESLPNRLGVSTAIADVDNSNPTNTLVNTTYEHGYTVGDIVNFNLKFTTVGLVLNSSTFFRVSSVPNAYYFYFTNLNGSAVNVTGTMAGAVFPTCALNCYKVWNANAPTVASPITLTFNHIDFTYFGGKKAAYYKCYKNVNGQYGYLGQVGVPAGLGSGYYLSFLDTGASPDLTDNPPVESSAFNAAGNYPGVVSYFQQRLMFANTTKKPESIFGSQIGRFKNFSSHLPLRDDDSVTYTMAGREVNEVRHLLDLSQLIILTSGGEHAAQGDGNGTLTPTSFNRKQYDYNGAAKLRPIVIGGSALYVQALASIVRDLGFEYSGVDNYRGNDLSIYSAHLVDGHTITDWCYQKLPHSVVWSVREDGALLGLTYVKEQQMVSWHRHDTDGFFENICTVPEGGEYAVYVVVRRVINGVTKRFVERFSTRQVNDIKDYIGMDSAVTYDGRNLDTTKTITVSGGTLWTSAETLTLTASASMFSAPDVGKEIHFTLADGSFIRFQVFGYSSGTVVTGKFTRNVPTELRSIATSKWARAVSAMAGLTSLEGKKVSILADGFVLASPDNPSYTSFTVTAGALTFSRPYSVIRVGLPFRSDLETLDIDIAGGQTLDSKAKLVREATIHVEKSRGLWVGGSEPVGADPLDGLTEDTLGLDQGPDLPMSLLTDKVKVVIRTEWDSNGHLFIRQVDPLPLTVLAISASGLLPFPRG